MPSSRRAALAAAAIVLLAAQATGVVHLVAAPHETCPVDGELVERAPSRPAEDARARPEPSRLPRVDGGGAAHAHDRCLATPGETDSLVPTPAAPTPVALARRPLVQRPPAQTAPRGPPLYHVAPKTSPPA
jgi:hypothetical protein